MFNHLENGSSKTKTDRRAKRRLADKYAPKGSQAAFAARVKANKGFARRPSDSGPKITIIDKTKK